MHASWRWSGKRGKEREREFGFGGITKGKLKNIKVNLSWKRWKRSRFTSEIKSGSWSGWNGIWLLTYQFRWFHLHVGIIWGFNIVCCRIPIFIIWLWLLLLMLKWMLLTLTCWIHDECRGIVWDFLIWTCDLIHKTWLVWL